MLRATKVPTSNDHTGALILKIVISEVIFFGWLFALQFVLLFQEEIPQTFSALLQNYK